jgi:hypothetical protein
MRNFAVSGYLIGVDGNRLIIKVVDDDINHIAAIKTLHKKSPQLGNFITINIKSAQFKINNLEWKELKDLIGVLLHITCTTRIYDFRKKINDQLQSTNGTYVPDSIIMNLVSFQAKVVKNIC